MVRYAEITEKNPREIVMLRGAGCRWRRCTFCDYHLDCASDTAANFALNAKILSHITGRFHRLEVINSGSFPELDEQTIQRIIDICWQKKIDTLHFECHWMYRDSLPALRQRFRQQGITVKVKSGIETFDAAYREQVLCKGIDETDPAKIAQPFDECCLLFGLWGQDKTSMEQDIQTGLQYFERVCVNIMTPNTTQIQPDAAVIREFMQTLYPVYRDNPRVDILIENTDFGIGAENNEE